MHTDPLSIALKAARRTRSVCLLILVLAAAWAFRPLPGPTPIPVAVAPPDVPAPEVPVQPLMLAAFDAPVFTTTPPPPEPSVPSPPPPPPVLKLQLLGIAGVSAGSPELIATLYDPEADSVRRTSPGETVAGWRVESIDTRTVALRRGDATRHLTLRADSAAPSEKRR